MKQSISRTAALVVLLCLMDNVATTTASKHFLPAFAVGGRSSSKHLSTTKLSALPNGTTANQRSRTQFLQEFGIAGIAAAIFSSGASSAVRPSPAYAEEITESTADGIGGGSVGSILASSSIRSLKRSEKQLSKMVSS
jgi:hypothetical protein